LNNVEGANASTMTPMNFVLPIPTKIEDPME